MKKQIFIAAAVVAAVSGCAKEEGEIFSDNTFTGVIENDADTKTSLSSTDINWNETDEIYINGVAYTTTPDGTTPTKATFKKKNSGDTDPTATYKAFFADGTNSGSWNGTNYTLPASYTYSADKFNMPMYAESDNYTLPFKNLCGVLKLSVTSSTAASVSKIEISSDAQLNGAFTATSAGVLSFSTKTLEDADKTVTVNFGSAQTLSETATPFYIPVAPGNHTLSVKVYNGDKYSTLTMSSASTFERGTIYSLSDAKLHGNGGDPSSAI